MRSFGVLLTSLFLLCGCYDNHNEPTTEPFSVQANANIKALRQFCSNGCYNIVSDIVCIGRVTSSDREGNFYRSVFVQDETGAVEIKLGTYNIEAQYPIGLMVALRLNGCTIMLDDDILQVGLPPQSFDTAPREFEAQEVIDLHVVRSNSIEPIAPLSLDIPTLNTSFCGQFVRIENLRHAPLIEDMEELSMVDYHRFIDNEEHAVFTYISPYANFSTIAIPTETTTIQGILYHESVGGGMGRQFVIKPRFADDITDSGHNM